MAKAADGRPIELPYGVLDGRTNDRLVIGLEIALGAMLMCDPRNRIARGFALATYLLFIGLGIASLMEGRVSCGCFGRLSVSPWAILPINAMFVLCLAHSLGEGGGNAQLAQQHHRERSAERRLRTSIGPVLTRSLLASLFLTSGWFAAGLINQRFASDSWRTVVAGRPRDLLYLSTQQSIGSRFPLIEELSRFVDLQHGTWVTVLVDPDCIACRAKLRKVEELAAGMKRDGVNANVLVIDVSRGRHQNAHKLKGLSAKVVAIPGSDVFDVNIPLTLVLRNGVIRQSF